MPLRLVFMGTPEFAVPTLSAIVSGGHEIVAVYTRAPKPAGRGMELTPSPIEREARRLGLSVLTPKTLRSDEAHAAFRSHGADAAVVVAFGLILPPQPDTGITYATKIEKDETRIDWSKPWTQVHDHCRGLSPVPGAWFEIAGTRVKTLRTTRGAGLAAPGTVLDDRLTIACSEGAVRLLEVQRAGRRPMQPEEFLRGTPLAPGTRLS